MEKICECIESYSNLILAIMNDSDKDPLWHSFYRIQMGSFILGQKNLRFKLSCACSAYKIIQQRWTKIKSVLSSYPIPVRNYEALFRQVVLIFPTDEQTMSSEDAEKIRIS